MKNKFIAIFSGVLLLTFVSANAQYELDAMRYASFGISGTTRAQGAGGAWSAVGGDFSSVTLNPAGLGLYNRSELLFSSQLRIGSTAATYMGETGKSGRTNFNLSNLGYVYQKKSESFEKTKKGIRSGTFAIGYNQIDNYTREIQVDAYNPLNSIADYFATTAYGVSILDIPTDYSFGSMAWNTALIDTVGQSGIYEPLVKDKVQQSIHITEVGRKNEWTLSAGANLNDFIYFGGGIGLTSSKYDYSMIFSEEDVNNIWNTVTSDSIDFDNLEFQNIYQTKGTGFNAKAGVIIRPSDFFRFGISFTTPTSYSMREGYASGLSVNFDNDPNEYSDELAEGRYNYKLSTPYKVTTGAVFVYKKLGLISADFEFIDYAGSRLKSAYGIGTDGYYSFSEENQAIQDLFQFSYNIRVGSEIRLDIYRIRAGYARMGSVLNKDAQFYADPFGGNSAKINASRQFLTTGLGIKKESFYLDLAYVWETTQDRQILYTVADENEYSPELITKNYINRFLMTIGFTF